MYFKSSTYRIHKFISIFFLFLSFQIDAAVMQPEATKKFFISKKISYKDTLIWSGGRKIRFVCAGNDTLPVLFFIHGSPGAWSDYRDYMSSPALLKRFYMISADRPGYNGSKGEGVQSLEEQANCLQGVFQIRKNNQPITVFGHSYGGAVSVKFALQNHKQIKRLILISPCLSPDVEQSIYWKRMLQNISMTAIGKKLTPHYLKNSTLEMQPLPNEVRKMEKDYALMTIPILEIHGTWDMMAPYGNLNYIKKSFPNSHIHAITFKNKNHKIVYSMPHVMIGIILNEIDGISSQRTP